MQSNIQQYYPSFYTCLWKTFSGSDTRPTQVGDMDPWPVTWPNLSDLIGWGQKISSTSWWIEYLSMLGIELSHVIKRGHWNIGSGLLSVSPHIWWTLDILTIGIESFVSYCCHGPLARYIKLQVAHAPGILGTSSPQPRISDPDMHNPQF